LLEKGGEYAALYRRYQHSAELQGEAC